MIHIDLRITKGKANNREMTTRDFITKMIKKDPIEDNRIEIIIQKKEDLRAQTIREKIDI